MKRRAFIVALAGAMVASPQVLIAQNRSRRLGILTGTGNDAEAQKRLEALTRTLKELGWVSGENIQLDMRWSPGSSEMSEKYAKELISFQPDVILAHNTISVEVLLQQTRTIPIVFTSVFDPILSGIVTNLARPGGNVTGFTNHAQSMGGKWLELLQELAPRTDKVTLIWNPKTAGYTPRFFSDAFEPAARALHMTVASAALQDASELEPTIAELSRQKNSGLVAMADPFTTVHRKQMVALTARYRVPAAYPWTFFVTEGGLVSYGVDQVDIWRRAAAYIDRILRGQKPGDLPVQAPTVFELYINRKTAKALGLTIPQSLLIRADKVID